MAICEDAPCCGCCGTNLYGVYQGDGGSYDSDPYDDYDPYDGEDDYEDNLSDVDADAMTLAGAGYGTDEDYGYYGDEDAAMESGLWGDDC